MQHPQMNFRVVVAGKPHEADLAVFLSLLQRLSCSVSADEKFGIIVKDHAMDLQQIEMISLQTPQRLFKHREGQAGIAPVWAGLCQEKYPVANAFEPSSHPDFCLSPAVLPAVVEKCNPSIDRLAHNSNRSLLVGRFANMVAAKTKSRNLGIGAPEISKRNGCTRGHGHSLIFMIVQSDCRADSMPEGALGLARESRGEITNQVAIEVQRTFHESGHGFSWRI
jgi:hypothetical protein